MRKLLVPLLAVIALVAAGAAAGKTTTTVTISKTGYKPTAVSIVTGDEVIFKNTDTVAHTVMFTPATGMNCSAAIPLVIAAGQSANCTFPNAGKFKFSDPASNKKAFRGTITVSPPLVSSIKAAPATVVYGANSTVSGKVVSGQSGQSLQVMAQECGATKSSKVATVTTTAGGAFAYSAQPSKRTAYSVSNKSITSGSVTVKVKPGMKLSKIKRHRYRVTITSAQSFTGKVATFQRFRPTLHRWVKVKRVTLGTSAAGKAPTVTTTTKFRSRIKARVKVRVSLGPKQVAPCYVASHSNAIRS